MLTREGVPYTYDNNGNLVSKANSGGTTSYAWDFENRLSSVTLPSGNAISFTYDPFGRRIRKASPAGTTVYVYDGSNIEEELNASGGVVERYTYGPGVDEPLVGQCQPKIFFYEADGLGSVTSLTDPTGAVAATYTYDSFGFLTNSTGSATNWFRYAARQFDSDTALYYYRARYYDPTVGRFISEDPTRFTDGTNFYAYVHNTPLGLTDPLGLTAYNEQQTMIFLQQAYTDATAGRLQGLWNIRNHSQGGGDFDFGHNEHGGDTFVVNGTTMSAGDFANFMAGFQAGAYTQAFPVTSLLMGEFTPILDAYWAGLYYHMSGQSDVPNDPFDLGALPWIDMGARYGLKFNNEGNKACKR